MKCTLKVVGVPAAVVAVHLGSDYSSWLAVKNGSVPDMKPLKSGGIPRNAVVETLRAVLTPQDRETFFLIHGETGVGKSTLVLQAAHAAVGGDGQKHGGIIYMKVPEDTKWVDRAAMGRALGAAFHHNKFRFFDLWERMTGMRCARIPRVVRVQY